MPLKISLEPESPYYLVTMYSLLKAVAKIGAVELDVFQLPPPSSASYQAGVRYPRALPPDHKHGPEGLQDEFCPRWLLAEVHSPDVN